MKMLLVNLALMDGATVERSPSGEPTVAGTADAGYLFLVFRIGDGWAVEEWTQRGRMVGTLQPPVPTGELIEKVSEALRGMLG